MTCAFSVFRSHRIWKNIFLFPEIYSPQQASKHLYQDSNPENNFWKTFIQGPCDELILVLDGACLL